MSDWQSYPASYRQAEVSTILKAIRAGESVNLIGLSGAGKSNLLGFLARARPLPGERDDIAFYFLDCNALQAFDTQRLLKQMCILFGGDAGDSAESNFSLVNKRIGSLLGSGDKKICLLLDRYELIEETDPYPASNNLRALRDAYKYRLTYLFATRRPLDPESELAELFYANSIWLGPMSQSDAFWNVERYTKRQGEVWSESVTENLIKMSWGYPSLLRGLCEAYAQVKSLDSDQLSKHPAVQYRIKEFWTDQPSEEYLAKSGLAGQPLLVSGRSPQVETEHLTAKEHALLLYLQNHPEEVCEKDDLIKAVWPEDEVFETGIRDDSLAQLIRRLRIKIEPDPSKPRFIQTIPGRGYRFTPK